jgi:tetratricopeptide (TPR) repeat protein
MTPRRLPPVAGLAVAGFGVLSGCYAPPDSPPALRVGALEPTSLVLQAVDAGTGSALTDDEMTVRYLVRAPIVFDASSVDRVRSVEPYEIAMPVGEEELVVEIRLEADSYHRLDTVFAVPRGTDAGPLTVRMSPRLDRTASRPAAPAPRPSSTGSSTPAAEDRSAMNAGDGAYQREAWLEATEAYQRMPAPRDESSPYGRDYMEAKIRQGIAHLNRSEYGRALEIFEEVVDMDEPAPDASLRLAQAQCAVGRTVEGRGTLAQVGRMRNRLQPAEQSRVSAMMAYQEGVCSYGEFQRAETTRDRVRAGAQATQQLNAFIEGAGAMSPVPPEVFSAVQDAERKVEEIRRAMGGGA